MQQASLNATVRDVAGKDFSEFRAQGLVPAVMYGNKLENVNLWVKQVDFDKTFGKAGENAIVELVIEGKGKINVLVHDVQMDPISQLFTHVDFFQVRMDEEVETEIPVEFVGESEAVKSLGGVLVKHVDEISVSCFPGDLPEKFEIDLGTLRTFDDRITIADIPVSEKVKILANPDTIIVAVSAPRGEEELAELNEKVEADVSKVGKIEKKESKEGETEEK